VLSGWSKFSSDDYSTYADFAMVSVSSDSAGNTPWSFNLQDYTDWGETEFGEFFLGATTVFTPWYYWEWTIPESAVYELRLMLYGDDELHSCAGYDGISLAAVPEPATILLISIGILALTICKIDSKKNQIDC
jgi:hypothetical protein